MKLSATVQRILFYGGLTALLSGGVVYATHMPGHSHTGELPPETASMHAAGLELEAHVVALSAEIGEREVGRADSLTRARRYVESELQKIPLPAGAQIEAEALGADGSDAVNVILELPGERPDVVLVGAHYDSAPGTPGANDNASGVAVGLHLARTLAGQHFENTLRFVFFANEEPPYFQNPGMGSLAHARGCAQRGEKIVAMLALESLGFYSEAPGSQRYPWPVGLFYPERGNFVGFVGNLGSRSLVHRAIGSFRAHAGFPSEGAALPGGIPGVGWSDHWAFWQFDYPAIMVTDTAVYRDPNYHQSSDVPANLSYGLMARVALGLHDVIADLAGQQRRAPYRSSRGHWVSKNHSLRVLTRR